MTVDLILTAVLWGCIIAMLITLHKLGRLFDNMLGHIRMAKVDVRELQDMIQQKIDEENREKEIDDFIDELNKKHNEENK
jgi:hypothetical protein